MPIYRESKGQKIKGELFKVFLKLHGSNNYQITDLKVYSDGYMDCLGERNIEEIKEHLHSGKLNVSLPEGSTLFIPYIGYIGTNSSTGGYDPGSFIQLLMKTIKKLNNESENDLIKTECIRNFKTYLIDPSQSNFIKLKETYHSIPTNERMLFEIIENKDPLVKLIKTEVKLTRKEREYYLIDYFEGEWINIK